MDSGLTHFSMDLKATHGGHYIIHAFLTTTIVMIDIEMNEENHITMLLIHASPFQTSLQTTEPNQRGNGSFKTHFPYKSLILTFYCNLIPNRTVHIPTTSMSCNNATPSFMSL